MGELKDFSLTVKQHGKRLIKSFYFELQQYFRNNNIVLILWVWLNSVSIFLISNIRFSLQMRNTDKVSWLLVLHSIYSMLSAS